MANFEAYQEYQRIEDFEEDSPPGEEDLLVHVPEGLKGKHVTMTKFFHAHLKSFTPNNEDGTDDANGPWFWRVCIDLMLPFILQIHGTISRTWITSSQGYPFK